ncbi:MAG: hypothetical protein JNL08_00510 [Planctomycetes bacterium]|nr:hypothetical protein [Planctomycetota bacterium]
MRALLIAVGLSFTACSSSPLAPTPGAIGFDGFVEHWRQESTGGTGPNATWQARADATAISPPNVMALVAVNHSAEERFNLCWTQAVAFRDGRLGVVVRADGGDVDQGGGPMWRVKDAANYYVCRYNPLEANYRVYVVANGVRRQLATALVEADGAAWHRLEVEHTGHTIRCYFDGDLLLEAEDPTIDSAGGVGLWTKADARTSFDDLVVEGRSR